MAESISLAAYAVRIYEGTPLRGRILAPQAFADIAGVSFSQYLADKMNSLPPEGYRTQFSRAISAATDGNDRPVMSADYTQESLSIYFDYGAFGYTSKIKNRLNATKTTREVGDTDNIPMFGFLSWPEESDFGVFLFQTFGQRGIKGTIGEFLSICLRQDHPALNAYIRPFHDVALKREMLRSGELLSAQIITPRVPQDNADGMGRVEAEVYNLNLTLTNEARGPMRGLQTRILNAFSRGEDPREEFENYSNRDIEDCKLTIRYRGVTRVVNLMRPNSSAPRFPIGEEVTSGANGHPNRVELQAFAEELAENLFSDAD